MTVELVKVSTDSGQPSLLDDLYQLLLATGGVVKIRMIARSAKLE